jgi:hypothetical protein
MDKYEDKEYGENLFESLQHVSNTPAKRDAQLTDLDFEPQQTGKLRKMKKFRFQLLHQWLNEHFEPCRIADVAGGKGLLAYLLQKSDWEAVVIDPVSQSLPSKYKNISNGRRVFIPKTERVPRIDQAFEKRMACKFDMLIGMHAHGCNAKIIDAADEMGKGFVLFPCCVIDEPFYPRLGVQWLESLADYAVRKGHVVYPFRLNFKGQNIGLCTLGKCKLKKKHNQPQP